MANTINDPPQETSSPPLLSSAAAPLRAQSSSFSLQIPSVKLTKHNYLTWSQFVRAILKSNRALKFVHTTDIPMKFLSDLDYDMHHVNHGFLAWEEQDQAMFSWLLNSISESLHPRVVGCVHSCHLWSELHAFCNSHTKARSHPLRTQLRSLSQGSMNISEFLSKVKTLSDSLISIGTLTTLEEHINCIFYGLNEDFQNVITSIESRIHPPSIHDLEQFLLILNQA
ncbi:PREDICTED: uncharacterized protein LOC109337328 [Lupinus angustifolius]|uniref:uncharacterized protein LOC109337328 n=1 Tax=Lupinus angustifolius TaxID=3871 RepID=UPI00092F3553|nr:PREDICTED: uncharacterized protein LOC109337328 [Lupinus angustifolius]